MEDVGRRLAWSEFYEARGDKSLRMTMETEVKMMIVLRGRWRVTKGSILSRSLLTNPTTISSEGVYRLAVRCCGKSCLDGLSLNFLVGCWLTIYLRVSLTPCPD